MAVRADPGFDLALLCIRISRDHDCAAGMVFGDLRNNRGVLA